MTSSSKKGFTRLARHVGGLVLVVLTLLLAGRSVGAVPLVNVHENPPRSAFVTVHAFNLTRPPDGSVDCAADPAWKRYSCVSKVGLPKARNMQISISNSLSPTFSTTTSDAGGGQVPTFTTAPSISPASGVAGSVFTLSYGLFAPETASVTAVLTLGGIDVTADIVLSAQGMTYTPPSDASVADLVWQVRALTPSGNTFAQPAFASVTAGTTQVAMGGVTFTLEGNFETGVDAGGKAFVVVPSGTVTLLDVSPAQSVFEGAVVHGLMKNPQRTTTSGPDQGYDGRFSTYDPALSAALPLTLSGSDVVVKTVGRTPHENRKGAFDEIAALHVVTQAPPAGAFLGPSIRWDGYAGPEWYATDLETFQAGLPQDSATALQFPPFAVLMQSLDQFFPLYAQISSANANVMGYENASPYGFGGGLTNYGRYTAGTIETAMLALVTDAYAPAEIEVLLRRLVQHGIEWGDPLLYGPVSVNNGPDGGHHQFHQGPVALALALTGRSAELPSLMERAPGNWAQAIKIDAAWLQGLAQTDGPFVTRHRTLPTQPGGATVRLDYENNFNGPSWYQTKVPAGARIVRAADGLSVAVVEDSPLAMISPATGTVDVPVDTASPFAQGDIVYIEMPQGWIAEGLYDWTLRGRDRPFMYSPTASNKYRDLQRWGSLMALQKMGLAQPNMDAVEGYIRQASLPAYPTVDNDYPITFGSYRAFDGNTYSVSPEFFDQYWAEAQTGGEPTGPVDPVDINYTPDTNVTLTFDTALTPDAQASSMADGIVIGLVPGTQTAPVRMRGTASGVDGVEVRIRRHTGGTVLDWTLVAVAQDGIWDSIVNLPKADDWWVADARPVNNPDAVQSITHKFAVGYKIMLLGQSQIARATRDNDAGFPMSSRASGTASFYEWQTHNNSGNTMVPEKLIILDETEQGSDALRAFVDQFRAFDPDTPLQIFRECVSGTGILDMLDDTRDKRRWSDLTDKTDKYGGDVSVVIESWNTANISALDGHQDIDLLNGLDTHGFTVNHALPDVLQDNYVYAVQPATRHAINFNDSKHAVSKVDRAQELGLPIGFSGADYYTEDFGGPHAATDGAGNIVFGARMAILAADAMGIDVPQKPHFPATAVRSTDGTILRITPVLPNGGTLWSPSPDNLRMFEIDYGTGLSAEGFTARIAENGLDVELIRTQGEVFPPANFIKINVLHNGYLNKDLSDSGQTLSEWKALEQSITDGQLYETYDADVTGRGLPVMGAVSDGLWHLTLPDDPIIKEVVQEGAEAPQAGLTLISEHKEVDYTVAGFAEGNQRERLSVFGLLDDGVSPEAGSQYLIGTLQISGRPSGDLFFDQVEARNSAGYAVGQTDEIAMVNQSPGSWEMRVQAFLHTDTGNGRDIYAKSTNRKMMSYIPVYKIDGFTMVGAMIETSTTGLITFENVQAGSAIVVFAQNRDGQEIVWNGVIEDGAYSLDYEGNDHYQAAASGISVSGGTVFVGGQSVDEMVAIVLPPE